MQWKESTNRVIDKKQQLEIMLNESLKLEQINSDFLNRIADMEKKVQGLPEPSFGKDTLRKQKTEYKVYPELPFSFKKYSFQLLFFLRKHEAN